MSQQDNLFLVDTREIERFYHVVGVSSGTKMTMYLDGQSMTSRDISLHETIMNRQVQIGGTDRNINPNYFNGVIDDVRIYNRALSEAEVKSLYEFEKP